MSLISYDFVKNSTLWIGSTEAEAFAFFGSIDFCGLLGEYMDLGLRRFASLELVICVM